MSVSEETAVSMLVSWVPPNAHVLQYHVSYTPLTGDARENKVSFSWSFFIQICVQMFHTSYLDIGGASWVK